MWNRSDEPINFRLKSQSLKSTTALSIDFYNYGVDDNNTQNNKYKFNFVEIPTVRGLIGKINQMNYAIETPIATIGIKSTASIYKKKDCR